MICINRLEHLVLRSSKGPIIRKCENEDFRVSICDLMQDALERSGEKNCP